MGDIVNQLTAYSGYLIGALALFAALLLGVLLWRALRRRIHAGHGQRLDIVEHYEVDQARRLVLIRRDTVEHLLLIGGNNDLVIESNIGGAARGISVSEDMATEPMLRAPGRPPAPPAPGFGERRFPPMRQGEGGPPGRDPSLG